ncbi:MAG: hypothetical protein MUE58_14220 [Chitinophagaceae bacterium]|nr:hypothetical protein [Chitinophagaceae bacterium]
MLRYLLAGLILIHGLIHWMGFAKAFGYAEIKNITGQVSKPMGLVWLLAAILFMASAALLFANKPAWWIIALPGIILSQVAILQSWQDAKFGTVANIIVLFAAVFAWGSNHFEGAFRKDVREALNKTSGASPSIITEDDLRPLPLPVRKYLQYSGVVGTPRAKNMRVEFEGEMRDKGKEYFPFHSVQYNFFEEPTRLFFMKARMKGMTVPGYHHYHDRKASMDIRLFGLFPVVRESGPVMDTTETVTFFNDMCLLAPASLLDPRIRWEEKDSLSAKAIFTNGPTTISAILYFNEQGQLVNFMSEDRTAIQQKMKIPFSTPVHAYRDINGRRVLSEGDAVWHYPEGAFTYGKFRLKGIAYNVEE